MLFQRINTTTLLMTLGFFSSLAAVRAEGPIEGGFSGGGGGNSIVCFSDNADGVKAASSLRNRSLQNLTTKGRKDIFWGLIGASLSHGHSLKHNLRTPEELYDANLLPIYTEISKDELEKIEKIESIDLYRARRVLPSMGTKLSPFLDTGRPDENPNTVYKKIVSRIKVMPAIWKRYSEAESLLFSKKQVSEKFIFSFDVFALKPNEIQRNCVIATMFLQQSGPEGIENLVVDESLFRHPKHSSLSRAAIEVHEVLYSLLRDLSEFGELDFNQSKINESFIKSERQRSDRVVKAVSLLLADKIGHYTFWNLFPALIWGERWRTYWPKESDRRPINWNYYPLSGGSPSHQIFNRMVYEVNQKIEKDPEFNLGETVETLRNLLAQNTCMPEKNIERAASWLSQNFNSRLMKEFRSRRQGHRAGVLGYSTFWKENALQVADSITIEDVRLDYGDLFEDHALEILEKHELAEIFDHEISFGCKTAERSQYEWHRNGDFREHLNNFFVRRPLF